MTKKLYYTFGNHMHWVDMEWLWGYFVLPASIRDMLAYCRSSKLKGNINFDAPGYEKLSSENPEALSELRTAVQAGTVEVVGGSYAQPYGLFHGGESNVRQRVYGVRSVMGVLGTRPKTFWEEEFDFFPQLPQMLRGVGYEYASLFFQWTWHTPHIPEEEVPAIMWEGIDGSQLLAATRNGLSIHQWPEDFQEILAGEQIQTMEGAGLVQWLELMPSPDWMCRSELMTPLLEQLAMDSRFDLVPVTLSEYLEAIRSTAHPKRYTMAEVYHGMSLGKNGDVFRRMSIEGEATLLAAETAATIVGYFGRPYAHWDAYPTWELEEAWRELLAAQHHDNDECEGLCGHVGRFSYERSKALADHVLRRSVEHLARRSAAEPGSTVVYNPLGFDRRPALAGSVDRWVTIPALSYATLPPGSRVAGSERDEAQEPFGALLSADPAFDIGSMRAEPSPAPPLEFDSDTLTLNLGGRPLARLELGRNDRPRPLPSSCKAGPLVVERVKKANGGLCVLLRAQGADGEIGTLELTATTLEGGVDIEVRSERIPVPEPADAGALRIVWLVGAKGPIVHDHPYSVDEITRPGTFVRKYPTGDWMTSPQVYEDVEGPFTAHSFVDFAVDFATGAGITADNAGHPATPGGSRFATAGGSQDGIAGAPRPDKAPRRLQIIHDGSQGMAFYPHAPGSGAYADGDGSVDRGSRAADGNHQAGGPDADTPAFIETLLSMNDPWDEAYFDARLAARFRLRFYSGDDYAQLTRWALAFRRPMFAAVVPQVDSPRRRGETGTGPIEGAAPLPTTFSMASVDVTNVLVTAAFREGDLGSAGMRGSAHHQVDLPSVVRLVEYNGEAATVRLSVAGTVGNAWKTNLLGEISRELEVTHSDNGESTVVLEVDPREIATVYLGIKEAERVPRNLDEHRDVWAHAHRVGSS